MIPESQEFEDKISELIGREYDANNFHCWSLVEELVPKAPKLAVIGGSYKKAIEGFAKETPNYLELYEEVLKDPQNGDVLLAGNEKHLVHAGVLVYDSGTPLVIHNDIKGVHVEPLYYFKKKYSVIKVIRCQ